MTTLIKIEELADLAEDKGFRVRRGRTQTELWYPGNKVSHQHWYDGSYYSTADIVLDSNPGIGYGYNEAFNGPYHYGYVHVDSYGFKKLQEHLK
jgi:hypothetical protein